MPTIRQKNAVKNLVANGGNVRRAMKDANYSPNTLHTPKKLTESKGFKELINKYLPDDLLTKIHNEGLKATKGIYNIKEGIKIADEEDYSTRHKYLETAYKITGKLDIQHNTQVNVGLVVER